SCEPDMTKVGEYIISVTGAEPPDGRNYHLAIRYENGSLTVSEPGAEETMEPVETVEPAAPLSKLEISHSDVDEALVKELDSRNSSCYDLTLLVSSDGGQTWTESDADLPEGGVSVSLPLPEGSDETCSFRILHAGGEYPVTVTRHEDGKRYLDFTATELGSIAVGWAQPGSEVSFPWWILLLLAVLGGSGGYVWYRKRRR
ncbi:MAG: hypothetical protein IJE26_01040, partial [Oscillospiraceae bacterium]|nr:hypothetical protein [Oscillospiraceae bacterium]